MTQLRFELTLAVAAAVLGFVAPALADCGGDMQKLALARNAELEKSTLSPRRRTASRSTPASSA